MVGFSLFMNWVIGPLLMTAVAWITLPDLPGYRVGIILVGIARCIAMVLIWNMLAGGDQELCVMIVALNSIMQIVLFSPYAYLFVNTLGGIDEAVQISMWTVAKNVLIFLGVPLAAAFLTRLLIRNLLKRADWFDNTFLLYLGPTALIGLLFTIVAMFTLQGTRIISDFVSVLRCVVPLLLYFFIMFLTAFFASAKFMKFDYPTTAVHSFTAASNNFELAIALAIGIWGIDSEQALATVVGPLVEVPVLLILVYLMKFLQPKYFPIDSDIPLETTPLVKV